LEWYHYFPGKANRASEELGEITLLILVIFMLGGFYFTFRPGGSINLYYKFIFVLEQLLKITGIIFLYRQNRTFGSMPAPENEKLPPYSLSRDGKRVLHPTYSLSRMIAGFEKIHFPPGWADINSQDYWTVSFLSDWRAYKKPILSPLEAFLKHIMKDL